MIVRSVVAVASRRRYTVHGKVWSRRVRSRTILADRRTWKRTTREKRKRKDETCPRSSIAFADDLASSFCCCPPLSWPVSTRSLPRRITISTHDTSTITTTTTTTTTTKRGSTPRVRNTNANLFEEKVRNYFPFSFLPSISDVGRVSSVESEMSDAVQGTFRSIDPSLREEGKVRKVFVHATVD